MTARAYAASFLALLFAGRASSQAPVLVGRVVEVSRPSQKAVEKALVTLTYTKQEAFTGPAGASSSPCRRR
jgi:hypothetical protein